MDTKLQSKKFNTQIYKESCNFVLGWNWWFIWSYWWSTLHLEHLWLHFHSSY
jgi:hypothetical protein